MSFDDDQGPISSASVNQSAMSSAISDMLARSEGPVALNEPSYENTSSAESDGDPAFGYPHLANTHSTAQWSNLEIGVDPLSAFAAAINNDWEDEASPDPKNGELVTGSDINGNPLTLVLSRTMGVNGTQQNVGGSSVTIPNSNIRPEGYTMQANFNAIDFDFIDLDVCVDGVVETRKFPVLRN